MPRIFKATVWLWLLAGATVLAQGQIAVPPPAPAYQPLSGPQLDQLLAPIALYPDPLMAQILPAATYPTQIVLADRYVSGGGDPNLIGQQPWDASVQALAHYPNVLKWMDDNLTWTTAVGQAFLNQQPDVMDSIQRLRTEAYNLGNLRSTPQQQVINNGGYIEIIPVNPQVVYVPVYQPSVVYYQAAYGTPFITFTVGFAIGPWLNFDFDWHHHHVIVWNHDHPRPANWWHEQPNQRAAAMNAQATVWRPGNRPTMNAQHWGDRGWGNHQPAPIPSRPATRPSEGHRETPVNSPRPAPVQPQHYETPGKSPPNNTFIGIQNARDARTYSARGRESMQTMNHSAPPPRSPKPSSGASHNPGRRK